MNQITTSNKDGFDRYTADIVGDLIRKGKGPDWYRVGSPIDMSACYVALVPLMRMGGILWQDSKVADVYADYVSITGVPSVIVRPSDPRNHPYNYRPALPVAVDGLRAASMAPVEQFADCRDSNGSCRWLRCVPGAKHALSPSPDTDHATQFCRHSSSTLRDRSTRSEECG
jgi:hypothetical protein